MASAGEEEAFDGPEEFVAAAVVGSGVTYCVTVGTAAVG